jgi:hypothetical protein
MSDSSTYDNTGSTYNVSRILSADFTLDEEAYNNYSPLFLRYVLVKSHPFVYDCLFSVSVQPLPCRTACRLQQSRLWSYIRIYITDK